MVTLLLFLFLLLLLLVFGLNFLDDKNEIRGAKDWQIFSSLNITL